MNDTLAPIALFCYNRPEHTRRTLTALAANNLAKETQIYCFVDGPKSEQFRQLQLEVIEVVKTFNSQFKRINFKVSDTNQGLAQSIITGVTEVLKTSDRIIVLEDDLITTTNFLSYMNHYLDAYKDSSEVISIHGYIYPVENLPDFFFLRGADCWGWGTWATGWKLFNPDGHLLAQQLKDENLVHRFNFNGTYDYFGMLLDQIDGKNNSWAIRWYASAFLQNKLTLYPGKSLVHNIGNDSSGTHCSTSHVYDTHLTENNITFKNVEIIHDLRAFEAIANFHVKSKQPTKSSPIKRFYEKISKAISWQN